MGSVAIEKDQPLSEKYKKQAYTAGKALAN
jgi:hypothetical protein